MVQVSTVKLTEASRGTSVETKHTYILKIQKNSSVVPNLLNHPNISCLKKKTFSSPTSLLPTVNLPVFFTGAARSSTAYPWWSTRWTARVHPASTRRPSGETPPGTGCPQRLGRRSPEARPRRVPTACSASRSCSSTRRPSRAAPPSTGSCPMGPGKSASWCWKD